MDEAGSESGADPLLQSQRRHAYAVSRQDRLRDVYSVTLDTQQYDFLPAEPEPGMVVVDTLDPFALFGASYLLDLGTPPEIVFVVPLETAETLHAGYASDQVLLRVYFQLASLDDPSLSYCVTDGDTVRIRSRLLAAELIQRGRPGVVCQAQTERYRAAQIRFGVHVGGRYIPPQPRVQITSTAFPSGAPPEMEAEMLRVEAETRLMPCYHQGLNINGHLQGAVVIGYQVDEDGDVAHPAVTIDAVDQPALTVCVVGALDALTIPRQVPGPRYDVRMTVVFRLE